MAYVKQTKKGLVYSHIGASNIIFFFAEATKTIFFAKTLCGNIKNLNVHMPFFGCFDIFKYIFQQ
jgi:hypothetical protein